MVEARANFLTLAERRRERGDKRGEAEARVRLGDLDSADLETRLIGARARAELGDPKTAVERLKTVAADMQEKGRPADALRLLTEAAQIDPEDTELRRLLVQAYGARGDFEAASQFATSAVELRSVAEELLRQGRNDEGINVLRSAVDAEPGNQNIRAQLAQLLVERGDIDGARVLIAEDAAGSDPNLLWTLAAMELRDGRIVEGIDRASAHSRGRSVAAQCGHRPRAVRLPKSTPRPDMSASMWLRGPRSRQTNGNPPPPR